MARSASVNNGPLDSTNRRTHDRVAAQLSIATILNGHPIQIDAANISEGGAYCLSDTRFPVMTRLGINLELPPTNGGNNPGSINLDAIVVRCDPHPVQDRQFSLALYFPRLEDAARARIASFVKSRRDSEARAVGSRPPSDG